MFMKEQRDNRYCQAGRVFVRLYFNLRYDRLEESSDPCLELCMVSDGSYVISDVR